MSRIRMYSTRYCPFCVMARELFRRKGVEIEDIPVDQDRERRAEMERISGRHTVPQIFINQIHVGGYDDLARLDYAGQLDPLLKEDES
mgnify:CR=1 FL=1